MYAFRPGPISGALLGMAGRIGALLTLGRHNFLLLSMYLKGVEQLTSDSNTGNIHLKNSRYSPGHTHKLAGSLRFSMSKIHLR
jgi:hypothetical protein